METAVPSGAMTLLDEFFRATEHSPYLLNTNHFTISIQKMGHYAKSVHILEVLPNNKIAEDRRLKRGRLKWTPELGPGIGEVKV